MAPKALLAKLDLNIRNIRDSNEHKGSVSARNLLVEAKSDKLLLFLPKPLLAGWRLKRQVKVMEHLVHLQRDDIAAKTALLAAMPVGTDEAYGAFDQSKLMQKAIPWKSKRWLQAELLH